MDKTEKLKLLKGIASGKIDPKEALRKKQLTLRIGYPKDQPSRLIDGKPVDEDTFNAELARQDENGPFIVGYGDTGIIEGSEAINPIVFNSAGPVVYEDDPDYDI